MFAIAGPFLARYAIAHTQSGSRRGCTPGQWAAHRARTSSTSLSGWAEARGVCNHYSGGAATLHTLVGARPDPRLGVATPSTRITHRAANPLSPSAARATSGASGQATRYPWPFKEPRGSGLERSSGPLDTIWPPRKDERRMGGHAWNDHAYQVVRSSCTHTWPKLGKRARATRGARTPGR